MIRFLALFLVGIPVAVLAQYSVKETKAIAAKHADKSEVILKKHVTVSIFEKNGIPEITTKTVIDRLVLKFGGVETQSEKIHFDTKYALLGELKAWTWMPDGDKFKKLPVKTEVESDHVSRHAFSGDGKVRKLYFPNTSNGCITHLEYEIHTLQPEFISTFYLAESSPIEVLEIELIHGKNIDVEPYFYNEPFGKVEYSEAELKDRFKKKWTYTQVKEAKFDSDGMDISWYWPHMTFKLNGFQKEGVFVPVMNDISALQNMYLEYLAKVEHLDCDDLCSMAKEVTLHSEGELQKLKSLFDFVKTNIQYMAFTEGLEGFVPRGGCNVLNSRYGDCKGMSYLLYEMAGCLDIRTDLTWVGTIDRPYKYSEFASPLVDNHMILSYTNNDSVIFMDPTGKHVFFGRPSGFIQGKEALIYRKNADWVIAQVPVWDESLNKATLKMQGKISNKDLVGHGTVRLEGMVSDSWESASAGLTDSEKKKKYLESFHPNDGRLKINKIDSHRSEKDGNTSIDIEFEVKDYITSGDNRLFLNPFLGVGIFNRKLDETREQPKGFKYKYSFEYELVLDLPEENQGVSLPDAATWSEGGLSYKMDYSSNENQVIVNLQQSLGYLMMLKPDFPVWNQAVQKFSSDSKQKIIINAQK